jgi:hypothetical protein
MKKIVFASLLALGTSTLLAGCGLIPAQTVKNPLGLDNVTLTSSVLSTTSTSVSTRTPGTGTAQTSSSFPNSSSLPLAPASINLASEITSATYSAGCVPAATAPNGTITVTLTNLTVDLSDGQTADRKYSVTVPSTTFKIVNGIIEKSSVTSVGFSILSSDLAKVVNILTDGPTPNAVTVNTGVTTSPALPGCTVSFTFNNGTGTIGF